MLCFMIDKLQSMYASLFECSIARDSSSIYQKIYREIYLKIGYKNKNRIFSMLPPFFCELISITRTNIYFNAKLKFFPLIFPFMRQQINIAMVVRFITRRFIGDYDPNLEKVYTHNTVIDNDVVLFEILDATGQMNVSFCCSNTFMRKEKQILVCALFFCCLFS